MKLIVNADDFGIDIDRDIGIAYGVLKGYISSVSVVVTNKIGIIRKLLIKLIRKKASVGIHINLTDNPLTKYRMEELVFYNYDYKKRKFCFWENAIKGTINIRNIRDEINEQLNKFIKKYKMFPSHIDGHNHCNIFNKDIEKIFENISNDYNIHLRIPYEDLNNFDKKYLEGNSFFKDYSKFKKMEITTDFINKELNYFFLYDMYLNNYMVEKNCNKDSIKYIGTMYGYFRKATILYNQLINFKDDDTIQIMTHPGFFFKTIKHKTAFSNKERADELRSLKELKKIVKQKNIQYINYKNI